MKHQPVAESGEEEKKNCLNWRHVQISPSAFFDYFTRTQALKSLQRCLCPLLPHLDP